MEVGSASNNHQLAAWGAWIPDNKTVPKNDRPYYRRERHMEQKGQVG